MFRIGRTGALLIALTMTFVTVQAEIATLTPGDIAPAFALPSVSDGSSYTLEQFQDSTLTVVMWISVKCPVSNDYNERMVALANDYASRGVAFVGINANKTESGEECSDHAQEHNFPFVVLKDDANHVADQYGARVTPEIFVLSPDRTIKYHGRIDDARTISRIKSNDLRLALDALLAGDNPPMVEARAFGCLIKRVAN